MKTTQLLTTIERKCTVLFILVISTVLFGIYHAPILDAIHYSVSTLIYCFDLNVISCDAVGAQGFSLEGCANDTSSFLLNNFLIFSILTAFFVLGIAIIIFQYNRKGKGFRRDSQIDEASHGDHHCRH